MDNHFLIERAIHKTDDQHMACLQSDVFWAQHEVPFAQARSDKKHPHGALMMPSRQMDNKVIPKHREGCNAATLLKLRGWVGGVETRDKDGSCEPAAAFKTRQQCTLSYQACVFASAWMNQQHACDAPSKTCHCCCNLEMKQPHREMLL